MFDILVQIAKLVCILFVVYFLFPAFVFVVCKNAAFGFFMGKRSAGSTVDDKPPTDKGL
jgi:hypothetical protein